MTQNLSNEEQMTMTLLSDKVITQALNQIKQGVKISSVDSYDMSFRLLKIEEDSVNLELLTITTIGDLGQEKIKNIGTVNKKKMISYFEPIGVIKRDGRVIILNRYHNAYNRLIEKNIIEKSHLIEEMTIRESAVIAAFSMHAGIYAQQIIREVIKGGMMVPGNLKYDKKLILNGLNCELIMSFDGYPQFYLDDSYGLTGGVASYKVVNGQFRIDPAVEFSTLYHKLYERKLLSLFKNVSSQR